MTNTNRLLAVAIALALAATTMPTVWAAHGGPHGGGSVNNVVPTLSALTNTGATLNENAIDVIVGSVTDVNRATDLESIQISVSGADTHEATYTVSGSETTTKPGSFSAGWKVWIDAGDESIMHFEYEFDYDDNKPGQYDWVAEAKDEDVLQSSPTLTIQLVQRIKIHAEMVDPDTGANDGVIWGNWSAAPGDTNVTSNYLKVENTGATDAQVFSVSFSAGVFGTAPDTIDVDDNIKVKCLETDGTVPAVPDLAADATDADGDFQCEFTAQDKFMFVIYEIQDIPEPLKDQSYQVGFTVSAV